MPDSCTPGAVPTTAAFVLFHVPHCGDEVLPEMAFAHCAGELREQGVPAEVIHVGYDPVDAARWRGIEDSLVARLRAGGAGVSAAP